MTLQRQATFWLLAIVVFILFLVVLREILLPFVAGLALAYFLDPMADRIERLGAGRLAATSIILDDIRPDLHTLPADYRAGVK